MILRRYAILGTIVIAAVVTAGVVSPQEMKKRTGGPYYYRTWTGYNILPVPHDEISEDEAHSLRAYYVVFYNELGNVESFTKFLDGKEEYSSKYYYDEAGELAKEEVKNPDGSITVKELK